MKTNPSPACFTAAKQGLPRLNTKLLSFRSAIAAIGVGRLMTPGLIAAASLLTATAQAAYGNADYLDYAKVTSVEPVYETIEHRVPREECWTEQVQYTPRDDRYRGRYHARGQSPTPVILGALLGGALGNELGHHKRNKQVGAVAGAILGGAIGADIRNHHRRHGHDDHRAHHGHSDHRNYDVAYRNERRCKTHYDIETEQQLTGYDVQYRYHGHHYTTFTQQHPGKKLQLRVSIQPVE